MARDRIHDAVKNALIKDGWTVTHDPYRVEVDYETIYVDLAAERRLEASRGDEKIAVEIKSFIGQSFSKDLQHAIGQYLFYHRFLVKEDPIRKLYLALDLTAYDKLESRKFLHDIVTGFSIHLIVVDRMQEHIVQWKIN